jgi:molybdate transport system ATP-binding protein
MSLEIDALSVRGGFRLTARVDVPMQGLTAVLGPSGAGKTSLLRLIAGLDRASEGKLSIDGEVLDEPLAKTFVPPWQRRVATAFQDARLWPHLTVRAHLTYAAKRIGGGEPAALDEVVDKLGLGALLARRPAGLSGGERQRVALGRALLSGARLILADEPTAMVDSARRDMMEGLIRGMAGKTPILFVGHEQQRLRAIADRVLIVDGGRTEGPFDAAGSARSIEASA